MMKINKNLKNFKEDLGSFIKPISKNCLNILKKIREEETIKTNVNSIFSTLNIDKIIKSER
jgi:hypothetical protein